MHQIPKDLFNEIQTGLDFKDTFCARRVCKKWNTIFQDNPYANNVTAWELADLPQKDLDHSRKICETILHFETDQSEYTQEEFQRNGAKMYDENGESRLEDIWILPLLSKLKSAQIGVNCLPGQEFGTKLHAASIRAMLVNSRTTLEDLEFEVWEAGDDDDTEFNPFDLENLIAGVRFENVHTLTICVDWFRRDLSGLKSFVESKLHFCFPNLQHIYFMEKHCDDRRDEIQRKFLDWVKSYKFDKIPNLELH